MSFQDNHNGRGSPNSLSHSVAAGVFQTNTALTTFQRLVNNIGTSKDTHDHRQKLHRTRHHIMTLAKDVSGKIKALCTHSDHAANVPGNKKEADAELARDFQAMLENFQKSHQLSLKQESSHMPFGAPTSTITKSIGEEANQDLESQTLKKKSIRLNGEIVFVDATPEEIEEEDKIKIMESRLEELIKTSRQFADKLNKQDHTTNSSESIPLLIKAPTSERSGSKWCWWLLVVFIITAIILALILIHKVVVALHET